MKYWYNLSYNMKIEYLSEISKAKEGLLFKLSNLKNPKDVLKDPIFKSLFDQIKIVDQTDRAEFGKAVNDLRTEIISKISKSNDANNDKPPIDVTAPADRNVSSKDFPKIFSAEQGSINPLSMEIDLLLEIFKNLGFSNIESPEIDDDYNMFTALNFPEGHPARDDWDTFLLEEKDNLGKPLISPAHTSTMQQRVLSSKREELKKGKNIAYTIVGRVFRNEDVDARHEFTFYQLEGVYVGKGITVANLLNVLKEMFSRYYNQEMELKVQPFYFPFTEPSFEIAISCPFCLKKGCKVCSHSGWIELLGCGMIHPNVLQGAGIDSEIYTGFAWGVGINRLAMMKYGIEEIRLFMSGNLDFLGQFK